MANKDTSQTIIINGFSYSDEAQAKNAQKEAEGVNYMKSKTDMEDPDMVLQVYNQMVRQELFQTEVGMAYLAELQEYLLTIPYINNEEILPINVPKIEEQKSKRTVQRTQDRTEYEKETKHSKTTTNPINVDFKKRFEASLVINIVLLICIVCMFLINMTTNQTTILNYESQLIDKYEQWEQDLQAREADLEAREAETNNSEQ